MRIHISIVYLLMLNIIFKTKLHLACLMSICPFIIEHSETRLPNPSLTSWKMQPTQVEQ